MDYLKKKCACGGRIAIGSYRDLISNEIKVGGGVCEDCFTIVKLPDDTYDEFVRVNAYPGQVKPIKKRSEEDVLLLSQK